MGKKVGILTFQDAHNYGASLQAYALKKYITDLGYDAKIINYHHQNLPYGSPREREIPEGASQEEIEKIKYSEKDYLERYDKFEKVIDDLVDHEKEILRHEDDLAKLDIDFWVSGSDQIWNTDITVEMNKGYFLDFPTKGKKITYAVSMGKSKLEEKFETDFKRVLENIDHISVREDALRDYAKSFTDKEVIRVVDPTLLLERDSYNSLVKENKIKEKYLLLYTLVSDERLIKIAKRIAEEKNLKIIELNECKVKDSEFEQVSNAGPEDFLTLIKNAEVILSNSYHGTIFSIIFGKEFYTLPMKNRNARMETLLNILGMSDRFISCAEDLDKIGAQDYKKGYERLDKEVKLSREFLNKALKVEE